MGDDETHMVLVLQMLGDKTRGDRINAECAVLLSEESEFRELITFEEELQWIEHTNYSRAELYQLELGQSQLEGLEQVRSQVVRTCGFDVLLKEEVNLHSSIQILQDRLRSAENWLKTFKSSPTFTFEEKIQSWNDEREVLEFQLVQLRTRIAKLKEEPVGGVSPELRELREVTPTSHRTKYVMENAQIASVTQRTKKILSQARELLL